MTPSERRAALKNPDVKAALNRACELYVDNLVGFGDHPAAYFLAVDDAVNEALEDALSSVEIPSVEEWADGSDEAADREREESLGL